MKQIKFFVMALAAMSMFSCSTEEAADATIPDGGDGSTAYAQFTLKMPDATRAVPGNDPNDDAMDSRVLNAAVYVMSKGEVEQKIDLVKSGTGATEEWKSVPVKLAAGTRQMVAIVNGGTKFTFKKGAPFSNVVDSLAGSVWDTFIYNDTPTLRAVYFSSKVESHNITGPSSTNPTTVDLQVFRLPAKVIVRDGIRPSANFTAATYTAAGHTASPGVTTRAGFCVMAEANNSYLFQKLNDVGVPVNPTTKMTWTALPAAPVEAGTLEYRALAKKDVANSAISGLKTQKGDDRGGQFLAENIAGKATLNKEVTQLFVRVALRPTFYTAANNVDAPNTETNADVIANYVVLKHKTDINKSRIFKTKAIYDAWVLANDATMGNNYDKTATEYTTGFNYYAVPIKDEKADGAIMFSVMRNTIYNVTLGELRGFGGNDTGKLIDPNLPVEPEAWLQATVTIMPWTLKDIDAPLQ